MVVVVVLNYSVFIDYVVVVLVGVFVDDCVYGGVEFVDDVYDGVG